MNDSGVPNFQDKYIDCCDCGRRLSSQPVSRLTSDQKGCLSPSAVPLVARYAEIALYELTPRGRCNND